MTKKEFDAVAIGEILIDFTPVHSDREGEVIFKRNPGGAPANALASVVKLGGKGAFIGMVGKGDSFGKFLKGVLDDSGIESRGLKFTDKANTTLAFVTLDESGDRDFSFYRNPGADTMITEEDLDLDILRGTRFLHFGSLSLTHEPARTTAFRAIEIAKEAGAYISYDPNLRLPLWPSLEKAKEGMLSGIKYADLLKVSEEEMEVLTGESDIEKGSAILLDMGPKLVIVTRGADGSFYRFGNGCGFAPSWKVKAADATGAGDAIDGSLMFQLGRMDDPFGELTCEKLDSMLAFSNAVAAICVSGLGAIPSMPTYDETVGFMETAERN